MLQGCTFDETIAKERIGSELLRVLLLLNTH